MNVATIAGTVGIDPELKYTSSGTAVMRLRVATSERRKRGDEWEDHTEWHTVTVFGKRAEGLQKVLGKGSRVAITGRLETRTWEDRDGNKRSSTAIVATDVTLQGDGRSNGARESSRREQESPTAGGGGFGADDIPFKSLDDEGLF